MSDIAQALVEALGPKVAPFAGEQAEKWAETTVSYLEQNLVPKVPDAFKGMVAAALASLRAKAPTLQKVAADEFISIANHVAAGHDDAARAAWILAASSDEDVLAMLDADSDAAQKAAQAKADEFAMVKSLLAEVGPVLVTVLAHLFI